MEVILNLDQAQNGSKQQPKELNLFIIC